MRWFSKPPTALGRGAALADPALPDRPAHGRQHASGGRLRRARIRRRRVCLVLSLIAIPAAAGDWKEVKDPGTGLASWTYQDRGFSLQLIQLLPDFVSALYSSRGLSPAVAKSMADYCVFGTIIRNDTAGRLSYRVADWRYVTPDGQRHRLKTKTAWIEEWKQQGSTYQWSILPDDQTFEPGDWSQGFTTVALQPDSRFDLIIHWNTGHARHQHTLEGLRCAPQNPPGQ